MALTAWAKTWDGLGLVNLAHVVSISVERVFVTKLEDDYAIRALCVDGSVYDLTDQDTKEATTEALQGFINELERGGESSG